MAKERETGAGPERSRAEPGRGEASRGGSGERAEGAGSAPEDGGWVRRFVAAPPRLEETAALYESLGHEVRLERPGPEELAEGCDGCALATELFRVVYTRRSR